MTSSIERTLFRLLKKIGISVSFEYIKEQVTTHPNYPSLLCITSTLEHLGIDHLALLIGKDKLEDIPTPFIIHTTAQGGRFFLIEEIAFFKRHPELLEQWDGVVLAAEKPNTPLDEANEISLKKEKYHHARIIIGIAAILLLGGLALTNGFSVTNLLLLITYLTGLAITILIVQRELGYSNELTEQLCGINKQTDCDAVLHSNAARLPLNIQWSDIGMIYFAAGWLTLVVQMIANGAGLVQPLLAIVTTSAIPFTLFSLYYQWRIVRKWCVLCLFTIAVLWFQFICVLPILLKLRASQVSLQGVYAFAFSYMLAAIGWSISIAILKQRKELKTKVVRLSRFKRNTDLFVTSLQHQRRVETTVFKDDLQLGNPYAPLQLTVACNPYCGPCAEGHKVLHKLVEKYNRQIGLTIRFTVPAQQKEDKRTQAIEYIIQHINVTTSGWDQTERSRYCMRVLLDWYEIMDINQFKSKYAVSGSVDVGTILTQYGQWSEKNKISYTPSVFINGHELPKAYTINDLPLYIGRLIDDKNKVERPVPA